MYEYGLFELHVKAKAREQTNNFFNTLKLYSAQKIGLNRKPWAKNAIFPPPHDEILTVNRSEKERFSVNVNRQVKNGQTAKPIDYNRLPLLNIIKNDHKSNCMFK